MEETQNPPVSIYSHALKFGIILGIVSVVCVILSYVIDLTFMVSFKFLGLMMIVGLGLVIYAGINYRNEIGGYIPYGKAFIHGIAVLAISGLISTIFNIVLYSVIDPELPQKMVDAIIQNTEEMMQKFGAPEESIEQSVAQMRIEMPDKFTTVGLLLGYLKTFIGYAVIAAITALFVKKNEPVEL